MIWLYLDLDRCSLDSVENRLFFAIFLGGFGGCFRLFFQWWKWIVVIGRNPAFTSWYGSLSHYLQGSSTIQTVVVVWDFWTNQQYHWWQIRNANNLDWPDFSGWGFWIGEFPGGDGVDVNIWRQRRLGQAFLFHVSFFFAMSKKISPNAANNDGLAILCDLFWMVKWPFQGLSDRQLGDQKVTLNQLRVFV